MDMTFLPFRFPGIETVRCAFGSRAAGNFSLDAPEARADPAATAARRRGLPSLLRVEAVAEIRQVHGVRTLFEPEPWHAERPAAAEGDGMATRREALALAIKTADCQPLLLAHSSGRVVAAAHVGWRGNRQNYPGRIVAELCERYDLNPADLSAVRGPSLGPAAAEFTGFDSEWGESFRPWFDACARVMNLWRLTRDQLIEAGLRPERIYGLDLCTASLADAFFSYRADRNCGRQLSLIWIEKRHEPRDGRP
ncbi:MAG: laccase domain-containing protein [Desulfovibrionaceae bacterium]|nr:laccase domain-containing protein [Desulfovibrionaceae bacterium]